MGKQKKKKKNKEKKNCKNNNNNDFIIINNNHHNKNKQNNNKKQHRPLCSSSPESKATIHFHSTTRSNFPHLYNCYYVSKLKQVCLDVLARIRLTSVKKKIKS